MEMRQAPWVGEIVFSNDLVEALILKGYLGSSELKADTDVGVADDLP